MTRFAQIAATGRYVPERVMTNAEFEPLVGKPVDQWLIEKVGMRNFLKVVGLAPAPQMVKAPRTNPYVFFD